ncbi:MULTISPECIES: uracil-DNA glycosylase [unclassified Halobacillus]|uniref:uracil-DNA glycosylase n=1 Tax=unclassified Halobacillus TaxID=2636472 RepID=UPI0002A50BD6|nr:MULTISPECIES: uracil-DNA glycosylase [unclassified Halobacillus]ELK46670.1 uracil-DNA glycosylase [Halobacillus sp. BAB-2008]
MEWPKSMLKDAERRMEGCLVEGFVPGKGNRNAEIMLVGEAPGEKEAVEGVPFIGRAGKELDKQLEYLGLERDDLYITSVVRSRPYKWVDSNKKGKRKANRKPNKKEIEAHAPLLDYQVEQVDPDIILVLGGVALRRLTGEEGKISVLVGQLMETPLLKYRPKEGGPRWCETEKAYRVIPLYHPAAVFYNPKIKPTIQQSLDDVKRHLYKED